MAQATRTPDHALCTATTPHQRLTFHVTAIHPQRVQITNLHLQLNPKP